jgi:hypothetical protein
MSGMKDRGGLEIFAHTAVVGCVADALLLHELMRTVAGDADCDDAVEDGARVAERREDPVAVTQLLVQRAVHQFRLGLYVDEQREVVRVPGRPIRRSA